MKKAMPILLILAFLGLVLQVAVIVFITEKDTEYTLKTEDNIYNISEHLEVVDNVSYYNIGVSDQNDNYYTIFLEKDFNKQTEIVRDIKTFTSNNVSCIFPIFRRDVTSNVTCLYNGESVSYDYLKQIGNSDIDAIVTQLKEEEYSHGSWEKKEAKKVSLYSDGRGIEVYQENILEDYVFLVWRYKGLYILKSEESLIKDYLDNDVYDNSLSAIVGRYYVTADKRTAAFRVSELYYYNTKDLGKGTIELPDATSTDFYFNGVYNDLLYMTDVGNKKQFTIDPAYEKVVEVGNSEKGFISVVDGKKKTVEDSEFLSERVYFYGLVSNEEISAKYGQDVQIKKDGEFYYFKTSDGKIYRSHKDNPSHGQLLFKFDNITEWKVKNGDVLVANGATVYFYNEEQGILPIAYNTELTYNYNNIIDFWKM